MTTTFAIIVLAAASCDYGADIGDCRVACTDTSGCPSGFSCSTAEGLCRSGITMESCSVLAGCADRTRDGFTDMNTFPSIAACAGNWDIAGLVAPRTPTGCETSGNDSSGAGCAALDLCAPGWRICDGHADVADRFHGVSCDAEITTLGFYATNQGSTGTANCADPSGFNDLFGCAMPGFASAVSSDCLPLLQTSGDQCQNLTASGWSCPDPVMERSTVTKLSPPHVGGGVLCCKP